jgi:hypothetical protein
MPLRRIVVARVPMRMRRAHSPGPSPTAVLNVVRCQHTRSAGLGLGRCPGEVHMQQLGNLLLVDEQLRLHDRRRAPAALASVREQPCAEAEGWQLDEGEQGADGRKTLQQPMHAPMPLRLQGL